MLQVLGKNQYCYKFILRYIHQLKSHLSPIF